MDIKKADIRPEKLHICFRPFPQRLITTEDYLNDSTAFISISMQLYVAGFITSSTLHQV